MEEQHFNIAEWIEHHAKTRPFQRALVFPCGLDANGNVHYTQLNFLQTQKRINQLANGFLKAGIKKGERVCVFVKLSLDFMPIIFALYRIGAIVVLIDPGMGRKGLLDCVERIGPTAMVGVSQAMIATRFYPKKFKSVRCKITVGGSAWIWGGYRLDELLEESTDAPQVEQTSRQDEASILFTSGSTGPAKGVRYTHGILDAQTQHIKEMYGFEAGEIDLPCFPLFGLFSLAMGMTVVIPDMDPTKPAEADPQKLIQAIEDHGCTSAFASPSLWKSFAAYCLKNDVQLPSLKRILSAGAPIPPALHAAFRNVLSSGVEIFTPYGATESLPVASIGSNEVLSETASKTSAGLGTCVGHLAPNMTVKIIKIEDGPIPLWANVECMEAGEIGEICVSGPVVTTEYKEEPEHTKAAKIYDEDRIWHRMGDLGYFDSSGRLWFCGRKSHRVICSNKDTLFPVPCEAIFNQHDAVFRSALVGVNGEPIIIIEATESNKIDKKDLVSELYGLGQGSSVTKMIRKFLFYPAFPVDVRHNAKIDRIKLRDWAKNQDPVGV